jgi:rhodanese-related sulfurtransferase
VVDVRSPSEFRAQHIDGAVNIPSHEIGNRFDEIVSEGETILVCQSGIRSEEAAALVSSRGRNSRQLDGGMAAWVQAGLPTTGRGGVSIERQVQMTIGTFVLLGTGLGVGVTPWLLIVPAFMGAGLLFAGVSGTCALASVIARLPWNRRIREETAASAAAGGSSSCAPATGAGCAAPGKPQS